MLLATGVVTAGSQLLILIVWYLMDDSRRGRRQRELQATESRPDRHQVVGSRVDFYFRRGFATAPASGCRLFLRLREQHMPCGVRWRRRHGPGLSSARMPNRLLWI
jgi:hypothetical protein